MVWCQEEHIDQITEYSYSICWYSMWMLHHGTKRTIPYFFKSAIGHMIADMHFVVELDHCRYTHSTSTGRTASGAEGTGMKSLHVPLLRASQAGASPYHNRHDEDMANRDPHATGEHFRRIHGR